MDKKTDKKITLEQLAQKIDIGFKESDKRTDHKIEQLAKKMDSGFKESSIRFKELEERMDISFKASDKRTDHKIDKLAAAVKHGFDNLSARVDSLQLEMNERFNKVDGRFRETQEEINSLRKYIERIGKSSLEDTDALADEMITLKRKISSFEKRLEKVELKTFAG